MSFTKEISKEDTDLWCRLQSGDEHAFDIIYRENVQKLYREISKRIRDQVVVSDLVQDIFLSLWEKKNSLQPQGAIFPYLYGMATNRVLNYYRKNRIQPEFIEIWENLSEEIADLDNLSLAFGQAHTQEVESLLERAITELPPRMREVYKLRYENKMTVQQIAELFSLSSHTVYNHLKAIRKRFVETLKRTSYFFF